MKSPAEKAVEIVEWAISVKGMTQVAIEDRAKIARGTIGKWRYKECNMLSATNLGKLLVAFPEISAEWAMRDEGPMLKTDSIKQDTTTTITGSVEEITFLKAQNEKLIDEAKELMRKLEQARKMLSAILD